MAKEKSITLSPKQLGEVAKADFCPRCFWVGHKMGHKYPYGMFPGIFSTLDKYQKAVALDSIKLGIIPKWLQPLGEISAVEPAPHWSKFSITLPNGIVFRGAADTLLRLADRSLVIVDEKTAQPKEPGHELERLYDAQLNGYAKIANAIGMGPVSKLLIVYNVPIQIGEQMSVQNALRGDRYVMEFEPVTRIVPLEPDWLDGLLNAASTIILSETCPSGNAGCSNCALIDNMAEVSRAQA